jgi:hypothetical protein
VDVTALLRARAEELRLRDDEIAQWAARLDERIVRALLSALITFEDALGALGR